MIRRIKFKKGEQRKFIKDVLKNINSPSIKELANRLSINYSTLKNYIVEERLLPENIFDNLCFISKINKSELDVEYLEENWGQVKGGKISKRN